jgi:hypothetical protein
MKSRSDRITGFDGGHGGSGLPAGASAKLWRAKANKNPNAMEK